MSLVLFHMFVVSGVIVLSAPLSVKSFMSLECNFEILFGQMYI